VLWRQSGWATKSVPSVTGGEHHGTTVHSDQQGKALGMGGGCSAVGLAGWNSTARRVASISCCSSSEATEKSQTAASECRRLVCKHEARGWRPVALIVQSDLTA